MSKSSNRPNSNGNPATATTTATSLLLSAVLAMNSSQLEPLAARRASLTSSIASMPASRRNSLQSTASTADLSDLLTTETLALPKTPPPPKIKGAVKTGGTSIPLPAMGRSQQREVSAGSSSFASQQSSTEAPLWPKDSSKGTSSAQAEAGAKPTAVPGAKPTKQQVDELWNFIRQDAVDSVTSSTSKETLANMAVLDQQLQLDEETLRGITQRPSGAWQAQIYYAGKTRYIGCFESKMVAAQVYQTLRERLKKKRSKRGIKKRQAASSQGATMAALSRSSSTSSLPPLKKRLKLEGNGATNGGNAVGATAFANTSNDYAYHRLPASAAAPHAPFAIKQDQTMAMSAPAPPPSHHQMNSFGGQNYAPMQQQPHYQQQQQLVALQQQQWMQQQMMPPPPMHQPQHMPSIHQGNVPYANNGVPMTRLHPNLPVYNHHPKTFNVAPPPIAKKSKAHNFTAPRSKKPSMAKETTKNPEDEKKWKEVRAEVIAFVRKNENSTSTAAITMDKELLRGITMRPSGKFQAQMYFSGQSRYIGVFDSKEQAALAYEMIRNKIKPPQMIVMDTSKLMGVATPKPKDPAREFAATAGSNAATSILPVNTRAITPSPTTVGNKHGNTFAGTPPYMMKNVTANASSPLASQQANSHVAQSSHPQQAMVPTNHFGLSIGHYMPSQTQFKTEQ